MIISGELIVQNRKKALIVEDLRAKGFNSVADLDADNDAAADAPNATQPKVKVDNGNEFDYLLKMPIWNLTHEKVEELRKERDAKKTELNILIDKTPYNLWDEDLDSFTVAWEEVLQADIDEANYMGTGHKGKKIPAARGRATAPKAVAKKMDLDDDDFEDKKPKVPVVKKAAPAVKKESEVVKTAIKQEPISSFFSKPAAATTAPSVTSAASSSVQKKQQSIMDMMKAKPVVPFKEPVKSEAISEDDTPVKASSKRGNGRPKKIISDDEDEDDYGASHGVSDNDDGDVAMKDVEVAPREPSSRAPRAARAKRPAIVDDNSDFDMDEDDFVPVSRKPIVPASPRKMTKSSQPDIAPATKTTKEPEPSEPVESSADEGYTPKSFASNTKGKITYKARSRVMRSDSEDEDANMDAAGVADDLDEDDDDEDDYKESIPKKRTTSTKKAAPAKAAPAKAAPVKSAPSAGRSTAKAAVKKMFSLSNDDDEDMEDPNEVLSGPDEATSDLENGSVGSSGSRTVIPPAIADEDDDSMFSIMAPSKVSQVKKRAVVQSRGGGSASPGSSHGTEVYPPSSFSTSVTSTGAVAGAKTLNSASSGPAKAPKAVASSLLADLEDVSNIVSRPKTGRATSKKPTYVDISD